ncbi:hypothetical protein F7Q99_27460 [Streptomyces kaniharaensis]|uniref:DUF998 domain-containing protein n=1 Tax=Streptomyces kaniharaensis TaxID=212423 RepID=A0A6N7KYM1_9ACTN|nr:hypothetical protein [Streptomyces kaniharaensis]MQS15895.1 hypothetical protein [Streptomyces kaniharaensis]
MIHDWRAERTRRRDSFDARNDTIQDERSVTVLRLGVGVIGIVLPLALPLGNWLFAELRGLSTAEFWPASMSGAYYTSTRNILVGSLCALGVFLVCYRFDRRDDRWSTAAGVCALGVALFPTTPANATTFQTTIGALHLVFAGLLFFVLAMFCVHSFRDPHYEQRRWVGRGYLAAGVAILALLLLAVVAGVTHFGTDWTVRPVYLCEWLATWAFGAAWTGAAFELASATGALGRSAALPHQSGARAVPADGPTANP